MIINAVLFLSSILFLLCCFGSFFFRLLQIEVVDKTVHLIYGFVFMLSLFEIVSFPFLVLKRYFNVLYIVFFIFTSGIVAASVYWYIKGKKEKKEERIKETAREKKFWKPLFLFIMILQIGIVSYLHYDCYDDGYYIAVSNAAIEQDIIELNDTVAYSGNYFFEDSCTRPGIQSWELLIAFLSKLYKIHPAIMTHSILPILLIPVYYMAVWEVFKRFTQNGKERYLCMFLYALAKMFFGNGRIDVSYLAAGTWTGKAVLFHLIIPMVWSVCMDIYREDDKKSSWSMLWHLFVAGTAATATGLYTVPIYCLTLGLPYILILAWSKDFKRMFRVLWKAFLSMSGVLAIGLCALLEMIKKKNVWAKIYSFDWKWETQYAFQGNIVLTVLFVIALCLILKFEKRKEIKGTLAGSIAVLLLIFWNPWIANFLAVKATGVPVYWRMLVLLPVSFAIDMATVWAVRWKKEMSGLIVAFVAAAIIFNGRGTGNMMSIYSEHENWYMIPREVLGVCEKFDLSRKETIVVLAEQTDNKFFRQYSSWFDVVTGRNDQIPKDGLGAEYFVMYEDIFTEGLVTRDTLETLDKFKVEYLVLREQLKEVCGYELYDGTDTFFIYRRAF